ncbi:MAG: ABC transporter ATP-binding protein [Pseudomonadota bacterium]
MTADGAPPAPLLSVQDLTVALPEGGDRPAAVEGVSLEIARGETLCLVGQSGSGKSVVAQAILGMLPRALRLTGGSLSFDGAALPAQRDPGWGKIRSARIAMIFQDAIASLDPVMRVGRQLEEILAVHGVPRGGRRARVIEMLGAVRLPDPERIFHAFPHQLSGGQGQRVVIAGALLLEPELLVADEPTTALDVTTQAEILSLLTTLQRERGSAVLFITHDIGVVAKIADRIAVMQDGRLVETGPAARVLRAPAAPETRALLAATMLPARQPTDTPDVPLMEATRVSLVYRSGAPWRRRIVRAVDDVSLTLNAGETLAVVGESGSGKSSLARLLLRLEPADAGRVHFAGRDITALQGKALRTLRRRVQVVLQDPWSALNPRQRIGDAIAEGPIIHGTPRAAARTCAAELLALTGLSPQSAERLPQEFSGGQRQRICIARALALNPEVLIADEAVSALDVAVQAQILDLFRDLQTRFGFALFFITHDLRVARAVADRVMVMQSGRVVEAGPTAQVFDAPRHRYTRALLAAVPRAATESTGEAREASA